MRKDKLFFSGKHPLDPNGIHRIYKFDNGYGASVIKFFGSYGFSHNKWELAIISFYDDFNDDLYDVELNIMYFNDNNIGLNIIYYNDETNYISVPPYYYKLQWYELDYSTQFTNDVVGYLTESQVDDLLDDIERLPVKEQTFNKVEDPTIEDFFINEHIINH